MPSAAGFEGIYALKYNAERNCATLTNISHERDEDARNGRVLLLRGEGQISEPLRLADYRVGWIRHTTAKATAKAVEEAGTTGSVVILPGETASYSPADIQYTYNVEVADAQVNQIAKVAESLATQAADDVVKNPLDRDLRSDLTNSIVGCAIATKETWAEHEPGNTGFPNVLTKMKTLPQCESTYARIDDIKEVKLPAGWRQELKRFASRFDDLWSQGLQQEAIKAARIIIQGVR